ncbi:MAG: MotA/TolQ/ExbB proton channel family protein [Calditrichaeota bacterium]|nr:MotA/TolQ/ExbB proton channel family protein [Calditrichota bacterium]
MNLLNVLVSGGWIMILIAISSLVVIAIGVSRFMTLQRENQKLSAFIAKWRVNPGSADSTKFRGACKTGNFAISSMAAVFDAEKMSRAEATDSLETAGRQALYKLESGIGVIGTLAAATPLVGFLGTVTGMIRAFMQIQKLGGNVNANVLAGGIWEALVTTAAGLAVGILALIIHNYLASLVKKAVSSIEKCGQLTMHILGSGYEN